MQVNINKIKGLMAENGDTQKDLADKLKVNRQTVNNWFCGHNKVSLETLTEIAKIYKVEPLTLIKVKD